jgi:hypothetical protein
MSPEEEVATDWLFGDKSITAVRLLTRLCEIFVSVRACADTPLRVAFVILSCCVLDGFSRTSAQVVRTWGIGSFSGELVDFRTYILRRRRETGQKDICGY